MDVRDNTNDEAAAATDGLSRDAVPAAPATRAAHFVEWFRRGLMVVTAAAFVYVAHGYVQLFRQWRGGTPTAASTATASFELMPLAGALPLDGPWTFADLNWNLRSSVIAADELDARIRALAEPAQQDWVALPDVSDELLHLIKKLRLAPVAHGGNELYSIDRATLKAQLLVRKVGERTKAITFAAAYPQGDGRWQMFELTPQSAAAKRGGQEPHLLPLPTGARRQGGRFADDGRLLLELVALNSNSDALTTTWKAAGWEVRPSGFGNGDSFSYLCRKGDEVVYAWSSNPTDQLQNIMLVHSPTTTELEAHQLVPND